MKKTVSINLFSLKKTSLCLQRICNTKPLRVTYFVQHEPWNHILTQKLASYRIATYKECQNAIKRRRMLTQTAQHDAKVTMDFENGLRQRRRISDG